VGHFLVLRSFAANDLQTNFRAELKYVLQLLSSHPDNEQLKIEIEDDYDGVPKRMDFEILLNVSFLLCFLGIESRYIDHDVRFENIVSMDHKHSFLSRKRHYR
jgi:hypothetical protein